MDNIRFECFCGQPIEVNSEAVGQMLTCPSCNTDLIVPGEKTKTQRISYLPSKPPVIPIAERIEVKERNSSGAWALFLLGLVLLPFFGIGLVFIIIAVIVETLTPKYKSINFVCGSCGNFVSATSLICPTCRIKLIEKSPWWKF